MKTECSTFVPSGRSLHSMTEWCWSEKWIHEEVDYLGQVQEEMLGGADDWGLPAHLALGFLQRAAVISRDTHGSNS